MRALAPFIVTSHVRRTHDTSVGHTHLVIRTRRDRSGLVTITFALPDEGDHVAVIGCFNGWDSTKHVLKRRSNGTRSTTLRIPPGTEVRFRYAVKVDEGLRYFDDPDASWFEPNGFGDTHGVLAV